MSGIKKATTFQEQVEILKSRGCTIDDEYFCIETLSNINYYRFSAYLLPFKNSDNSYIAGTSFDKIYHLYEFDSKLRNILYRAIEVIEVSLRTRLSYLHGHKYGALGYLEPSNFSNRHDTHKFEQNICSVTNRNKKLLFVKHHLNNYDGKFPIWVISELFSFGMISYFYSDLHTEDQKTIAEQYNVNYRDLQSWLRCLTDLRNVCAHSGRLYYRVFSASPASLNLSESSKRRLWGIILVLKEVYPSRRKWNSEYIPVLEALFHDYKPYINLYHLAFPRNWISQLKK